MKKLFAIVTAMAACAALCACVSPQNESVGKVPATSQPSQSAAVLPIETTEAETCAIEAEISCESSEIIEPSTTASPYRDESLYGASKTENGAG